MTQYLCRDCRWMTNPGEYAICTHSKAQNKTGMEKTYCGVQRTFPWPLHYLNNTCGESGRWFEPAITKK